ncbi:CaiB/BaiF CoA transferase family protein [Pseudochelatococcus lubricantis]|uniref:CaiB/BaiF CoA transferase family protein n=1 Tax=Pseudochelatococcus lubricantis TaxID=1538102 RepID=UPI0035ECD75E
MASPLEGIRIISLAHLYPGPFATMLLADMGADVIIVEDRKVGDRTRRFPGHFESLNRNKRAVALNLKDSEDRQSFLKLVSTADVVVEGFRPGVMERLGLSVDEMRVHAPNLICVSISGYGQTGPMRTHGAHDLSLQAVAGLVRVTPGAEQQTQMPDMVLSDIASAQSAVTGILAALLQRERGGPAATVDVSMLDSIVSWMAPYIVPAINGLEPARLPPADPGYGIFVSSDGVPFTISISAENALWQRLCEIAGCQESALLLEEERIARRDFILPGLRAALASMSMSRIEQEFVAAGIPHGPVRKLIEVRDDPQVRARGIFQDFVDPQTDDKLCYILQPIVFDGERGQIVRRAPRLGEHNRELINADNSPD